VDQALSSGQKPAAERPAAAASPAADLSFGRLDISKCASAPLSCWSMVLSGVFSGHAVGAPAEP
jgi:hypothetical protein